MGGEGEVMASTTSVARTQGLCAISLSKPGKNKVLFNKCMIVLRGKGEVASIVIIISTASVEPPPLQ